MLWRRMGATVLLMTHPPSGLVVLEGPASDLWDLLERSATLEELAGRLGAAYDLPAERMASEISPVLAELEGRAVLRRAAA